MYSGRVDELVRAQRADVCAFDNMHRSFVLLLPLASAFHASSPLLSSHPRAAAASLRPQLPIVASASSNVVPVPEETIQPVPVAPSPKRTLLRTGATFAASLLLPALAIASGGAAGEHLHLGQKVRA